MEMPFDLEESMLTKPQIIEDIPKMRQLRGFEAQDMGRELQGQKQDTQRSVGENNEVHKEKGQIELRRWGSQNTNDQMEMQVGLEGPLLTESQNTKEMQRRKGWRCQRGGLEMRTYKRRFQVR